MRDFRLLEPRLLAKSLGTSTVSCAVTSYWISVPTGRHASLWLLVSSPTIISILHPTRERALGISEVITSLLVSRPPISISCTRLSSQGSTWYRSSLASSTSNGLPTRLWTRATVAAISVSGFIVLIFVYRSPSLGYLRQLWHELSRLTTMSGSRIESCSWYWTRTTAPRGGVPLRAACQAAASFVVMLVYGYWTLVEELWFTVILGVSRQPFLISDCLHVVCSTSSRST